MSAELTDTEREEVEAGLRMDNDLWRDGTTDLYSTVFRDAAIERILTARLAAVEAERDRLAAAVERVEALVDEWCGDVTCSDRYNPDCVRARRLRALMTSADAATALDQARVQ